jgi:methylated-DNA-protein-cysteine methyltransferase-like protein
VTKFQGKFDQAICKIVSGIASGRVMSYGEVARAAGFPRHARMVSKAMSRSAAPLPWYRVVRMNRTLAFAVGGQSYIKQCKLLAKEGVLIVDGIVMPVDSDEGKSLDEVLWGPAEG